jgi:hypothetical protein
VDRWRVHLNTGNESSGSVKGGEDFHCFCQGFVMLLRATEFRMTSGLIQPLIQCVLWGNEGRSSNLITHFSLKIDPSKAPPIRCGAIERHNSAFALLTILFKCTKWHSSYMYTIQITTHCYCLAG